MPEVRAGSSPTICSVAFGLTCAEARVGCTQQNTTLNGASCAPVCPRSPILAADDLAGLGQNLRSSRDFTRLEPTPGLEPGTPSLRVTPEPVAGDHERPLEGASALQMRLFEADGVDRP